MRAASVVLFGMYGSVPDMISIDIANAVLFLAFAVTWMGARVFDGRKLRPISCSAGPAFWLVVCRLPAVRKMPGSPLAARLRHHHRLHVAHRL